MSSRFLIKGFYEIKRIGSVEELTDTVIRERALRAHGGRSCEFVARINDKEMGFLSYEDWQDNSQGFIHEIFILPAFRKKGVATLLLKHSEEYAMQLRCKSIRLRPYALDEEPSTQNLISWYSGVGYIECVDEPEFLEKFF